MKIGLQAWGSEGDIQPFTALAAGLVQAGHDVTLLVTDNVGRDYSGLARRYGYKLIAVKNPDIHTTSEEIESVWRSMIEIGNPIKQAEMVLQYGFDPEMENMYSAAKTLCSNSDVVIGHFFVYPLRVAAEIANVPMATVNIVHNCIPSAYITPPDMPDLGKWFYPIGWKIVGKMINSIFLPRINALRKREGLPNCTDVMTQAWMSERLNLLAVSPKICSAPKDWGNNNIVCGFLNPPAGLSSEELPEGLEDYLNSGERPLYFTFGSMLIHNVDYIRETASIWNDVVKRLQCRAIFQLPWEDLSVFETEANVFKVSRSPYKKVFPRCSVVIHHGGAGTTQSSLLSGCPSVIVAHMSDQFFWGSELERLGVAGSTQKRKGLSFVKLAKSISTVLSTPEMAKRATMIGSAMSQENGVGSAIREIEKRLLSKI